MDCETIDILKTVCTAGRVRAGFNGDSNARLEQLLNEGFLAVVEAPAPNSDPKTIKPQRSRRLTYKPTESGRKKCRQLIEEGAA